MDGGLQHSQNVFVSYLITTIIPLLEKKTLRIKVTNLECLIFDRFTLILQQTFENNCRIDPLKRKVARKKEEKCGKSEYDRKWIQTRAATVKDCP